MNQLGFNVSITIIIPTEKGMWDYISMQAGEKTPTLILYGR